MTNTKLQVNWLNILSDEIREYDQRVYNLKEQIAFESALPAGCFDTWTWEHETNTCEAHMMIRAILEAHALVLEAIESYNNV